MPLDAPVISKRFPDQFIVALLSDPDGVGMCSFSRW
jgi:hypothetical protein